MLNLENQMEVNTLILSKIVFGETSTLCFHGDFLASCDFLEFLKKLENRIHFLIGAPPDCPALILMINPGDRRSLIFCVSKEQKRILYYAYPKGTPSSHFTRNLSLNI